jgi:protein SCO1/2
MRRAALLLLGVALGGCDRDGSRAATGPMATNILAPRPDVNIPLSPFTVTDQNGGEFTSEAMEGHVTVVDFVFTSCPSVCPSLTKKMSTLLPRTPDNVRFLSISVDPENDTPARMTEFLDKYGTRSPRWSFVTGDPKVVEKTVVQGFKTRVDRDKAGTLSHGEHFVVVDKVLRIRGYFDATPSGLDDLVDRVRVLDVE